MKKGKKVLERCNFPGPGKKECVGSESTDDQGPQAHRREVQGRGRAKRLHHRKQAHFRVVMRNLGEQFFLHKSSLNY